MNLIEYENLFLSNEKLIEKFEKKFSSLIRKGWYVLGNEVQSFENEFSKYCNTKHCIGVANGLDGIIMSLRALKIPEGSEVIVPSNTYIATILAILEVGLIPVFGYKVDF